MLLNRWITRFVTRIKSTFPTGRPRRGPARAGGLYPSQHWQSIESLEQRLLLTLTILTTEEFRPLDTSYVVDFIGTGIFAEEGASFSGTATGTTHFEYSSATSGTGTVTGHGGGIGVDRFGPGRFTVSYDAEVTINDNQLATSDVVAAMFLENYNLYIPVLASGPVAAGPYNLHQSTGTWAVLNAGATSHGSWDAIVTQDITAPTDVSIEPLTPIDGLDLETTISVTGKLVDFESSPGTPVGTVHLAWASGPNPVDRLAEITTIPPINIYWNTQSINLKIPDLGDIIPLLDEDVPDETTHLQIYLELSPAVGDVDATNNLQSVPLGNFIDLKSVVFEDDDEGGVTVGYEVLKDLPPDVAAAAKLSAFWTTSAAEDAATGVRASAPININVAKGLHQFHIIQSDLTPAAPGPQFLKVAFDLGGGHNDIEGLRLKAAPLVDLIAAVNGPTELDKLEWNPALDETGFVQGGFTFTYEVKAPTGVTQATFRNPFIDFYWGSGPHRENVIAGELAFELKLTRDGGVPAGVEIRGSNTDLKAIGVHTIIVSHSALIEHHRSPTIDGTDDVAQDLMMVIDHPGNSAGYGDVIEMNDGSGLDNNVAALKVVPLMLNVATHGWDSSGEDWTDLGYDTALTDIPLPDSVFDGRVKTIITNWDSDGFTGPFGKAVGLLLLSKILEVAPVPGLPDDISAKLLDEAALVAGQSRAKAQEAARQIAANIDNALLPLDESNRIQLIHLVGHSRGGAVSAEVSRILARANYANVSQLTVLDGFSTDWPANGGLIGDFPIIGAIADRSVNYTSRGKE